MGWSVRGKKCVLTLLFPCFKGVLMMLCVSLAGIGMYRTSPDAMSWLGSVGWSLVKPLPCRAVPWMISCRWGGTRWSVDVMGCCITRHTTPPPCSIPQVESNRRSNQSLNQWADGVSRVNREWGSRSTVLDTYHTLRWGVVTKMVVESSHIVMISETKTRTRAADPTGSLVVYSSYWYWYWYWFMIERSWIIRNLSILRWYYRSENSGNVTLVDFKNNFESDGVMKWDVSSSGQTVGVMSCVSQHLIP